MNITDAFADYMATEGYGTVGTDLFIGGVAIDAPDKAWWVLSGGGTSILKGITNTKIKQYLISVYYRNTDSKDVYDQLQSFEDTVNSSACEELAGFDIISLEVTLFPTDQDLDNEDRTIGLAQVTVTVYS